MNYLFLLLSIFLNEITQRVLNIYLNYSFHCHKQDYASEIVTTIIKICLL